MRTRSNSRSFSCSITSPKRTRSISERWQVGITKSPAHHRGLINGSYEQVLRQCEAAAAHAAGTAHATLWIQSRKHCHDFSVVLLGAFCGQ